MVLSVLVSLLGLALGAASTSQGSQNICAGFALADVSNVKLTGTTHYAANSGWRKMMGPTDIGSETDVIGR